MLQRSNVETFRKRRRKNAITPPTHPRPPRYLKKMLQRIKGVFKNTYTRCCNVAMLQCLGNAGERALLHPPRNTSPKHTICESNSPAPRGAPPPNSRHASMIIMTSRLLLVWEETDMFDKLLVTVTTLVKMTHVPDTYHGQYLRFCGAQP